MNQCHTHHVGNAAWNIRPDGINGVCPRPDQSAPAYDRRDAARRAKMVLASLAHDARGTHWPDNYADTFWGGDGSEVIAYSHALPLQRECRATIPAHLLPPSHGGPAYDACSLT